MKNPYIEAIEKAVEAVHNLLGVCEDEEIKKEIRSAYNTLDELYFSVRDKEDAK